MPSDFKKAAKRLEAEKKKHAEQKAAAKKAVEAAEKARPKLKKTVGEARKINWISKLKSGVKKELTKRKKKKDTTRTKAVSKGLKAAGVTDAEIKKLRGKK